LSRGAPTHHRTRLPLGRGSHQSIPMVTTLRPAERHRGTRAAPERALSPPDRRGDGRVGSGLGGTTMSTQLHHRGCAALRADSLTVPGASLAAGQGDVRIQMMQVCGNDRPGSGGAECLSWRRPLSKGGLRQPSPPGRALRSSSSASRRQSSGVARVRSVHASSPVCGLAGPEGRTVDVVAACRADEAWPACQSRRMLAPLWRRAASG
jgi:hypothetical protein